MKPFHLGLFLDNRVPSGARPTDIAVSGALSVPEDSALGTVVTTLSAPGVANATFSMVSDSGGLFAVSGSNLIVSGVLDYETATSHTVTVRATSVLGDTYDESFVIAVTDVSEQANNSGLGLGGTGDGTPVDDGSFTNPPIATEVSAGIKLHGKKAAGSSGKFIFDIGPISPSTKYTLKYTPDFSLLTLQGKKAFVGFGFKQGNNFRLSGLKGDGATGINAYEIYGTNWNQYSGFSESDGGAALFGTQAGPNWLQIETNSTNTAYTLRTSSDGSSWSDEFTSITPTPFTDLDDAATFGLAAFFDSTDTGNFSISITLWTPAQAGAPLDGITGLTGAWSAGRKLLTAYAGSFVTNVSGNASALLNQESTGSARDWVRSTAAARPLISTAGPNSRDCLDFRPGAGTDGTNDSMENAALSTFISNSAGYFVASFIPDDAARTNFTGGSIFANDNLVSDASNFAAIIFQNGNMVGFNNDGGYDTPTGHAVTNGTAYVFEWWHSGGNLNTRLNGGTTNSVASGNTSTMTGLMRLGALNNQADFKFFEMAFFSTVPSSTERDAIVTAFRDWCGA